jgi:putative oxygen-independent coproporphyrinogen III oxidase
MTISVKNLISAYIHIPFCVSKCHYCDFNSLGMGKNSPPETSYVESLGRECERWSWFLNEEARVGMGTVFFGGGTPSLFAPSSIEAILQHVSALAPLEREAELTLELNPKTAQAEKMKGFRQVGINRLSIGIQTLEDGILSRLGRTHSASDALQAIDWAFATGFPKINVDLMYALPGQGLPQVEQTLKQLRTFPLHHLSAYELIIEEETPFYEQYLQGKLSLPETEDILSMRQEIENFAREKQMQAYEISNYAGVGHQSKHNCHYWEYEDYVGLGAGAVSFLRRERISAEAWAALGFSEDSSIYGLRLTNPRPLKSYEAHVATLEQVEVEPISMRMAMGEFMMMGLRKREGIRFADFEEKFAQSLPEDFYHVNQRAVGQGLVEVDELGCRLSEKGILLSNEVMQEFI